MDLRLKGLNREGEHYQTADTMNCITRRLHCDAEITASISKSAPYRVIGRNTGWDLIGPCLEPFKKVLWILTHL